MIELAAGQPNIFCSYQAHPTSPIPGNKNTNNNGSPIKLIEKQSRSKNDWIVIDEAVTSKSLHHTIESLLDGFASRVFTFQEGDILSVPEETTCLFSLDKLQNISPSSFNKHILYFFPNSMISLQDEFSKWIATKI